MPLSPSVKDFSPENLKVRRVNRVSRAFSGKFLTILFLVLSVFSFVFPGILKASDWSPIFLNAHEFSVATGNPSIQKMGSSSTFVPVWSFSGTTVGQSISGVVSGLPKDCAGIKVEILVTTDHEETSPNFTAAFRVHLSQLTEKEPFTQRQQLGNPVQFQLPEGPYCTKTILLDSWYSIDPALPVTVRIQREPGEAEDSFEHPIGLVLVKITPLAAPVPFQVVQDVPGYNSWPVIQALGNKLVCIYSRGTAHSIGEGVRGVYSRISTDGGKTWEAETLVADAPDWGEVTIGKGLDEDGALLVWVRRCGKGIQHDLYRSKDGVTYERISTPELEIVPMQITDVFSVPTVGLMALWFEGNYGDDGPCHSWGTLVSTDNGKTWTQNIVEKEIEKKDWPTEQAAVYLGDGKILAIARVETGKNQKQLISTDYGKTWTRFDTNIGDCMASTPSLIFDSETGLLSNYYYHRGHGVLRRRVVKPEEVFENPLAWPESEAVCLGSEIPWDSGNVNSTVIGKTHFCAFYTGKSPDTSVVIAVLSAPK